jgi:hypothetical protein
MAILNIIESEAIAWGFYQEDLPEGAVTSWLSQGMKPKTATGTAIKQAGTGGVLFTGTQAMSWVVDADAPFLHRWWIVIARANNPAGISTVLCVHSASTGNAYRQPLIYFSAGQIIISAYDAIGNRDQSGASDIDFADWNVTVGFLRGGKHHAWINGVQKTSVDHRGWMPNNSSSPSWMGAGLSAPGAPALSADIAIDCAIVGQSELCDADVDRIVGWAHHRAGRTDLLPTDHPYKVTLPTIGSAPVRYEHDSVAWTTWAAIPTATKNANIGNPPPPLDDGQGNDYVTVFRDDFVTDTVVDHMIGEPSAVWYAPGWNTPVGVNATLLTPSQSPDCYIHDALNTTMALRLQHNGANWVTGAFYSVNRVGNGRSWAKGRFRMRAKFPFMPTGPRPGFFPAFWCYDAQHLFWRTRNRLEFDFMEYDGIEGAWLNTTVHIHGPSLASSIPEVQQTDISDKMIGAPLRAANNFVPDLDIYDGQFHIWEFRIEDDFTYIIVDDKEACRVPTIGPLTRPVYLILDFAYRSAQGAGVPGQLYDMTVDWVEVQQRERWLGVPSGFSARPTLAGNRGVGLTVTCTPNATASQIEYRWYKSGAPIVGAMNATFVDTDATITKELRCHVMLVSELNQPESWTVPMPKGDRPAHRMRMSFATQAEALVAADKVHQGMIATNAAYAGSVAAGKTLRWAIPYQEPGDGSWYVNAKCRALPTMIVGLAVNPEL